MFENLRYRRQFLLTAGPLPELNDWNNLEISEYLLYTHPDLIVTTMTQESRSIFLLGSIFDPYNPMRTNEEVVSEVIKSSLTFNDLIIAVKPYFGRFVIIFKDDSTFTLMHDALAQKEVYYCQEPNRVICGSQPNLLNEYSAPHLGYTRDQDVLKFYENDFKLTRFGRLWVGDETCFQNIKHLMPNHYLDIKSMSVKRYWPNRKLNLIDLDEASAKQCDFLKGAMKAVTARHQTMVAVTSGFDSRSLLAASKDILNKIDFYINMEPRLNERSPDIVISKKIFEMLKRPFNVYKVPTDLDDEFKAVYLENVFLSTDFILPANYNVYYKNHQEKVNIDGTGEMGRSYFGEVPKGLDGYFLARRMSFKNSPYAVAQCDKWLNEVREIAVTNNVDLMTLLFWEFVMGNWAALAHSEAEVCIENFDIYDSHYVCEIMLSVGNVGDDLMKRSIRKMWPELLEFPFNPPDTIKDRMKYLLRRIGLFKYLQRILYRHDRRSFLRSG